MLIERTLDTLFQMNNENENEGTNRKKAATATCSLQNPSELKEYKAYTYLTRLTDFMSIAIKIPPN